MDTDLQDLASAFAASDTEPTTVESQAQTDKPQEVSDPTPPLEEDNAHSAAAEPQQEEAEQQDDVESSQDATTGSEDGYLDEVNIRMPDGSLAKFTAKDIHEGMLRQSDYSRKSNELAEKGKLLDANIAEFERISAEKLQAIQARYQQLDPINLLQQQLRQARLNYDNEAVVLYEDAIAQVRAEMADVEDALAKNKQGQEQKTAEELQEYRVQQRNALFEKLPALNDPKTQEQFKTVTNEALNSLGFSEEELSKLGEKPDHRYALMAYYAGLHLKSSKALPQAVQTLKPVIVSPKTTARNVSKQASVPMRSGMTKTQHQLQELAQML